MPDIAAGPGYLTLAVQASVRSPSTFVARSAPAPQSRGAADPCYPTRPASPLRAPTTTREDTSHRLLQPTYSTSTHRTAWFPRFTRLAASSAKVEGFGWRRPSSFSQLSTLSLSRRGVPDRTDPTLRRRFQPLGGLDSSTSDAPCRHPAHPARGRPNQKARTASTTSPSRDATFTLRSAFHRQVLLSPLLAQGAEEPATVLIRRCRHWAGFRRSASILPWTSVRWPLARSPFVRPWKILHRPSPGLITWDGRQIGFTPPVNFCNRYGSWARPWTWPSPRTLCRELPPCWAWIWAASRLTTRRWLSCHGSRGRRVLCSAAGASRRTKRGSFTPARSARTSHVTSPCPRSAGEAERGLYGTEVPTSTPADSARPSAQGLHHPTFREEGRDPRTRGAFHRWAAPKGWLRDSTGCHQPVE